MSTRMTWATVALLVALAGRAWGLTFGVGCADGCGVEQALVGEDHPCAAVLVNDAAFPVTLEAVHVLVHHADGDVTEEVLSTPELVQGPAPAMTVVGFTVPIEANDALLPGGSLALNVSADLTAIGVSFGESFGDRIAIVASAPPCHEVTTTTTTTVTTTTATTTTLLAARHPCNPHASPNSRWCR